MDIHSLMILYQHFDLHYQQEQLMNLILRRNWQEKSLRLM